MSNITATKPKYPLFEFVLSHLRINHNVLSRFVSESAESKRRTLLRLLAVAHAQRLDASVLVGNLAEEYRSGYRRDLLKLSDRLFAGTPIAAALEQTPGTLSEDDVLALQFAHQTGTMTQVFDQLLEENRGKSDLNYARERVHESIGYMLSVLLCSIGIIAFLMVFIVPRLERLCSDFGLKEPWGLRRLVDVAESIVEHGPIVLLGVIGCIAIISIGRVKNWFDLSFIKRRLGARGYARSADVLRLLSISTASGRPVPAALSTLARFHFDQRIRRRLLEARNEVEMGVDVWHSLADADLISSDEAEGLSSLDDPQVRAWAMRQLTATKQDQIDRRNVRVANLIPPIAILLLALVVAWLGFAMLQLLTSIVLFVA